jgi:uncharacterized cupredoxin-like copper-binding protein
MAPVLGALSTGHEIGLAVVGGIFIVFALVCSFVIPRRNPDFPGEKGMSVFIIASLALFAAMITAVAVFGAESHEAEGATAGHAAQAPEGATTIAVSETEFKINLPPKETLTPGKVVFDVKNDGKLPHDLAIQGPGVSGNFKTPLLQPGESAKLTVTLGSGTFTLYCTVPGHREAGMVAKISVG